MYWMKYRSRLVQKVLEKKVKAVLAISIYVWNNNQNPAFWEEIGEQIKTLIASNFKRIVMDGLIPPLCVYLNYAKITVISILIVAVIVYGICSVLQPMLIVIHDELGKIADFMDKVAYWLTRGYFAPYLGLMLVIVSGIALELITKILQNPRIWNLVQQTIAQMSSGPQIALRLLQSTALGDGLLKLLQSIQPTAWGDRLLVCYQHTWYQKSAAILAIGLRLPALQTLASV